MLTRRQFFQVPAASALLALLPMPALARTYPRIVPMDSDAFRAAWQAGQIRRFVLTRECRATGYVWQGNVMLGAA